MSKSNLILSRARLISIQVRVSTFAHHTCPSLRLRNVRSSETEFLGSRGSPVRSPKLGIWERLGEAVHELVASPLGGRSYWSKSDKIGGHPPHKKDVGSRVGYEPFLAVQSGSIKTPRRAQAGRVSGDVATIGKRLQQWVSLSRSFLFFPFLKLRAGSSASPRARKNYVLIRTQFGLRNYWIYPQKEKPSKSDWKSRAYWVRE